MKDTLLKILKILILILALIIGETYYLELISFIGIDLNGISILYKEILILIYYILIFALSFYFYKDELNNDFKRFKRNMFPNILMVLVFFVVVTLIVKVSNYFGSSLAESFKVSFIPLSKQNILLSNIDMYLIIKFIKNIIIIPFIMTVTYVLGVGDIFTGKGSKILYSGLVPAIISGVGMDNTFIFIIINIIPYFTLYASLAYIYRKNNTNITFSLITNILYVFLSSALLDRIL